MMEDRNRRLQVLGVAVTRRQAPHLLISPEKLTLASADLWPWWLGAPNGRNGLMNRVCQGGLQPSVRAGSKVPCKHLGRWEVLRSNLSLPKQTQTQRPFEPGWEPESRNLAAERVRLSWLKELNPNWSLSSGDYCQLSRFIQRDQKPGISFKICSFLIFKQWALIFFLKKETKQIKPNKRNQTIPAVYTLQNFHVTKPPSLSMT